MLAMLIGCGLRRRASLLALTREFHPVCAKNTGLLPTCWARPAHIRTVPIPAWVKAAIDEWKKCRRHR